MKIKDTLVQELKSKLKNLGELDLVYPKEQNDILGLIITSYILFI